MSKLGLDQLNAGGRRVLMRVDFNVPLDGEGRITDDTRIKAALPSLRHLIAAGAKVVVMSHLGRPKGEIKPAMSLRPVADRLGELLGSPVIFAVDAIGDDAKQKVAELKAGEVLLLENLRFAKAETLIFVARVVASRTVRFMPWKRINTG